jgi:1-deoxy-D-xylulose-5-phosphate reductoisomerase
MKRVAVLGSTGTIGVNTLDVISRHTDKYAIYALTANTQTERLAQQCEKFRPQYAVMVDEQAAEHLHDKLKTRSPHTKVLQGKAALDQVASDNQVDIVMAAIVGAAGLSSTLSAAYAGKRILLANKESLVMSGKLFMDAVRDNQAGLLPIDSEHNAIFQCLPVNYTEGLQAVGVDKILLTASGGPFRDLPLHEFNTVSPEQAIAHPNWNMGRKISVDSATMMNKGLELIEACWLFNTNLENIEVVLHPQSVIHSMVQYIDGSVVAQLGQPDMRTPIAHGLAWPERIVSGVSNLDLYQLGGLDFRQIDSIRYPCLELAKQAEMAGGTGSTVLNAANEIAVQAFLDGEIAFTQIAETVEHALSVCSPRSADTIDSILLEDANTRNVANEYISRKGNNIGKKITNG